MDAGPIPFEVRWVADRCLRVAFGPEAEATTSVPVADAVRRAVAALAVAGLAACEDLTPAYASVLLTFDLARLDAPAAERAVRAALASAAGTHAPACAARRVEIPTCYRGECAPDLEAVAGLVGLDAQAVVGLHAGAGYAVRFLGFAPGFPYLAGLPAALAVARLERPRTRVPAGSVAIAGGQAGIYPQATPGGWRLLGRTPLRLFDPARRAEQGGPALLGLGDEVRFVPTPCAAHGGARLAGA